MNNIFNLINGFPRFPKFTIRDINCVIWEKEDRIASHCDPIFNRFHLVKGYSVPIFCDPRSGDPAIFFC